MSTGALLERRISDIDGAPHDTWQRLEPRMAPPLTETTRTRLLHTQASSRYSPRLRSERTPIA